MNITSKATAFEVNRLAWVKACGKAKKQTLKLKAIRDDIVAEINLLSLCVQLLLKTLDGH